LTSHVDGVTGQIHIRLLGGGSNWRFVTDQVTNEPPPDSHSALACWWLSGRVLRPLHTITTTARRLSSSNLHERLALQGPRDELTELTELAETLDEMLDRLESAFDSQRRLVANASHELRTPLAVQRAAAQIGLAGEPTPAETARTTNPHASRPVVQGADGSDPDQERKP
jgi:signal transduction histidine kinase